jgi:transcriptional regulator with XRE-family HTH domain
MEKDELRKRRERLGLTQTRFADTIGISANTVSRYETGSMVIPKSMELILEALEKRRIEDLQKPISKA